MKFDVRQTIAAVSGWLKASDKRLLAGGGVVIALLLGGGTYLALTGIEAPVDADVVDASCVPKETVTVSAEDYVIGDRKAPVTLVEYLSQTCSHCAEFRRIDIPKIEENFVKAGLVRIVFREMHRNNVDVAASVLGRCLGRDAFLPFTDMLLEQQQTWMMREDQDVVAGLKEMARRAGMSSEDFDTCLKKQDLATQLAKASNKAAKDYCITGTPTLLLNGKKIEGVGTAYDKLDEAIRAELKKAGIAAPAAKAASSAPAATAAGTVGAEPDGAAIAPADAAAAPEGSVTPPAASAPLAQ